MAYGSWRADIGRCFTPDRYGDTVRQIARMVMSRLALYCEPWATLWLTHLSSVSLDGVVRPTCSRRIAPLSSGIIPAFCGVLPFLTIIESVDQLDERLFHGWIGKLRGACALF